MSTLNDQQVLNAIFNPNEPFDQEISNNFNNKSKYVLSANILKAKDLELSGIKAAENKDFDKSLEYFSKAIETASEWASSYNNRAQTLQLCGKIDDSLVDLDKAIELSKEYEDDKVYELALTQKGMILRLRGKDEEALECFKTAATYGNLFAKHQLVAMNPYAAMCNKMLTDLMDKVKCGQSLE